MKFSFTNGSKISYNLVKQINLYKNISNFKFITCNKQLYPLKNNYISANKSIFYDTKISNFIQNKNTFLNIQCMFMRSLITKRRDFHNKNKNYKMKDRKSLRKRIKIVGPSHDRIFAFRRVGFRHKRIKKSSTNKNKPKIKLLSNTNHRYIKRNLPYFKIKRVKLGRKPY